MSINLQSLFKRKIELETELSTVNQQLYKDNQFLSWKTKAINCIASYGQYVTTIDILRCVIGDEAYLNLSEKERKDNITKLSVNLNNLVKEGYVKKAKVNGLKGNYYGLPEWFQKNGSLKPEYADETIKAILDNITYASNQRLVIYRKMESKETVRCAPCCGETRAISYR